MLSLSKIRDASTITDLCTSNDLPEIEVISLIQESIPSYTLRADSITQFTGYQHQDWFVPHPALPDDAWEVKLTPDIARETLNYMVLSGKRVSQMTKTYNDIEAVTRLLEEKEKDLELTARIGQELLTHNNQLESQVAGLEVQLKEVHDRLEQTQHELHSKAELLAILAAEDDTSDPNTPTAAKSISVDLLQRKVASLEVMNVQLKAEATYIATETAVVEEKEKQLIEDISAQLGSAKKERNNLNEELIKYKEENKSQYQEIRSLASKLAKIEDMNAELSNDNNFLTQLVSTTKQTQDLLCAEILDLKEQYAQVLGLLNEAQDQIRKLRKRQLPTARVGSGVSMKMGPQMSSQLSQSPMQSLNSTLGAELETSLLSDSSLDSGVSIEKPQFQSYRRVFETVRSASRAASNASTKSHSPASHMLGSSVMSSTMLTSASSSCPRMTSSLSAAGSVSSWRPPLLSQEALGMPQMAPFRSADHAMSLSEEVGISEPRLGVPGQPGSLDFEVALGSITAQDVMLKRQLMGLSDYDGGSSVMSENYPVICRTPDSIMSTGSSGFTNASTWRLPEKLQIVKPIEGSFTLHQWSQLARPSLGKALDERPCVIARGQSAASSEAPTKYTLDDVEEDDLDESVYFGKQFETTGMTYTFTNSTVMHPEDHTVVTSSYQGMKMSVSAPGAESECTTAVPTPRAMSRRNSTSTFSTSLGLAKLLNERGITAAALTSPNHSGCATPCNSPERPSSPIGGASARIGFFASGAEYLRKTLDSSYSSRSHKKLSKDKTNIRLVDKIEEIGLELILKPSESSKSPLLSAASTPTPAAGLERKLSAPDALEPLESRKQRPESEIVQCPM